MLAPRNVPRRVTVVVLFTLALAACSSSEPNTRPLGEAPEGGAWATQTGEGFSIEAPVGWTIDKAVNGAVTAMGPGERRAAILPFFAYQVQLTPDSAGAALTAVGPTLVPGLYGAPELAGTTTVRMTSSDGASVAALAYTTTQQGTAGLVFASSPTDPADRATFARIFESFTPVGAPVTQTAPAYDTWKDTTEGAFSVEVPQGWQTAGAVVRPCPTLVQSYVQATSPDNSMYIKLGNDYPWFTEPAPGFGLSEGATYPHPCGYSSPVAAYRPGAAFITDYLLTQYPKLEILAVRNQPQLAAQLTSFGFNSYDAGEVEYTYRSQGIVYQGMALAITERFTLDAGGAWDAWRVLQAEATVENFPQATAHALHMADTLQVDPQWAQMQAELTAAQSQIIAEMNASISDTISEGYWGREAIYDAIFERRSDATLETSDFVDPVTGDTFELDSGPEYYWIDPSGTIVGTDTSVKPDIDFRELLGTG